MTTSISTTRRTGKHRKGTRFTEEERREYRRAKSEKVRELASLIGKLNAVQEVKYELEV